MTNPHCSDRQRSSVGVAGAPLHLLRANAGLGKNWTLHDLRHTAAARLIADSGFSLVDVQTVLHDAHVATTQLYVQPRLDEVVAKVGQDCHARHPVTGAATAQFCLIAEGFGGGGATRRPVSRGPYERGRGAGPTL